MARLLASSLFALSIVLLSEGAARAACSGASPTWSASPDFASVAACVAKAHAGDTVEIGAGSATWSDGATSASVKITKSLTIAGAGVGKTIITDDNPQGTTPIAIELAGSESVEIHDIEFHRVAQTTPNYNAVISFVTAGTTFSRIHDNAFIDIDERTIEADSPYLLIDANTFTCVKAWCANIIAAYDGLGTHPMDYGGPSFVFVENNVFDYSAIQQNERDGAIDCKDKGRFVFRYNDVKGTRVFDHGFDSTKSCMVMDVYDNAFEDNGPDYLNGFFVWLRGGTGLIHDNTMAGTEKLYASPITLTNYRSCASNGVTDGTTRACDGTAWRVCTEQPGGVWLDCTSDGDCAGAGTCSMHWCSKSADVLCAHDADCPAGETCTRATDGSGTAGYPCRDQIGLGTNQSASPLYAWGNTASGNIATASGAKPVPEVVDNGNAPCNTSQDIRADRDYCTHDPSTACGSVAGWSYMPFICPHPAAGHGTCNSKVAGRAGYSLGSGGGGGASSSGAGTSGAGANGAGGGAGGAGGSTASTGGGGGSSGCSCTTSGRSSRDGFAIALLAIALFRRRRAG
jgi:hypothetical protein